MEVTGEKWPKPISGNAKMQSALEKDSNLGHSHVLGTMHRTVQFWYGTQFQKRIYETYLWCKGAQSILKLISCLRSKQFASFRSV